MSDKISSKTLVPIGFISLIAVAVFSFALTHSKADENSRHIERQNLRLDKIEDANSSHYIEIIQRLTRIEEHLRKSPR